MEARELLHKYHEAWANADIETLKSTLADDFKTYDPVSGDARDAAWEAENCQAWHDAFPDTQVHIEQIIVENDRAAAYWVLTATHQNEYMDISPTNNAIKIAGMETHRIEDGKIAETWRLSDTMTLMQQLNAT
jgi:steroid delta-isomerase-like uncharacterized protein